MECLPRRSYLKLACTLVSFVITTVQVRSELVQAPVQPVQMEPGSGVAVSVTDVPCPNLAEQDPLFVPQLIPAGLLVMTPFPERPTDRLNAGMNVAFTVADDSSVTVQVG